MATSAIVPLETYLRSSYEPDAEYVNGEIEERPMGEYDHASWQSALMKWFNLYENDWNIRARAELRVKVSEANYRVPDVVVLDHSLRIEQVITHPPIAVFEILSPEDRVPRVMAKLADYAEMGIQSIFVIEPTDGTVWVYRNGRLSANLPTTLPGSRCTIDWVKAREYVD